MQRSERKPAKSPAASHEDRGRIRDRGDESDPATGSSLDATGEVQPTGERSGLHQDSRVERLVDRDRRQADDPTTANVHDRPERWSPDPHAPEDLGADAIALATQGGGSLLSDEDEPDDLESHVDREALASGIVPQLVSQASLESASISEPEVLDEGDEPEDDAPTYPRPAHAEPGRTGVSRVRRGDAH
jgi:hypothetical protein